MTLISSKYQSFMKKAFPILWFGLLAVVMGAMLLNGVYKTVPAAVVMPLVMAVVGYIVIKALVSDLADEVYDCGDFLLIKNRGVEDRILLSNIMNVSVSTMVNPPRITLRLVKPGKFGPELAFSPVRQFKLNPFARNPIAEDLITRAYRARVKALV
jgi:hypothetical protein